MANECNIVTVRDPQERETPETVSQQVSNNKKIISIHISVSFSIIILIIAVFINLIVIKILPSNGYQIENMDDKCLNKCKDIEVNYNETFAEHIVSERNCIFGCFHKEIKYIINDIGYVCIVSPSLIIIIYTLLVIILQCAFINYSGKLHCCNKNIHLYQVYNIVIMFLMIFVPLVLISRIIKCNNILTSMASDNQ